MHGRIFQIEDAPISPNDYITASDFEDHWFTDTIADCVSDDNTRSEDIEELRSSLRSDVIAFDESNDSFIILPQGKESYFACAYEAFNEHRDKTLELGLAEFACSDDPNISKFSMLLWQMNEAFCPRDSFYMTSDELGLIPIAKFIRQAYVGNRYYIGGVIDYKC